MASRKNKYIYRCGGIKRSPTSSMYTVILAIDSMNCLGSFTNKSFFSKLYYFITLFYQGTITKNIGNRPSGSDHDQYYFIDCGTTCSGVTVTLSPTSGDPDLYIKYGGFPVKTGNVGCSNCDCSST